MKILSQAEDFKFTISFQPEQGITLLTLSPELGLSLFSPKKKQPSTTFSGVGLPLFSPKKKQLPTYFRKVGLSSLYQEGTQVHKN